jgi:hypothetical protein
MHFLSKMDWAKRAWRFVFLTWRRGGDWYRLDF